MSGGALLLLGQLPGQLLHVVGLHSGEVLVIGNRDPAGHHVSDRRVLSP